MKTEAKPYYRLKEVIEAKYGFGRFDFGCEIVARFLSFGQPEKVTAKEVKVYAFQTDLYDALSAEQIVRLRSLFNLKTCVFLFTHGIPTQLHEHIKKTYACP